MKRNKKTWSIVFGIIGVIALGICGKFVFDYYQNSQVMKNYDYYAVYADSKNTYITLCKNENQAEIVRANLTFNKGKVTVGYPTYTLKGETKPDKKDRYQLRTSDKSSETITLHGNTKEFAIYEK